MNNPDVQNSLAHYWDHAVTNISELQSVLAQEFATDIKVQNENGCPINALFFALLDSPYGAKNGTRTFKLLHDSRN